MGSLGMDALRAFFDLDPVNGESWYLVSEPDLGFAQKPGKRPAVLRRWGDGPTAIVYPRTTKPNQRADAHAMTPHDHAEQYPWCCIDADGWVLPRYPRTVAKDSLGDPRCREEDPTTIAAIKAGRT